MTIANKLNPNPFRSSASAGPRLSPAFRVEMRPRTGPERVEIVTVHARTIASARHTARLAYPDMVVMTVSRA